MNILIFGEVLIDQFDEDLKRRGGAPFNVAWHLQGFGESTLFISRVGRDSTGQQLLNDMKMWGMETGGIQQDDEKLTGFVSVTNQDAHPDFEIHSNVAYDYIDPDEIDESIVNNHPGMIYHGSLALRNKQSREALDKILSINKDFPVFFDVNLRPPWWNMLIIQQYMERCNFLKCNDEELMMIVPYHNELLEAARDLLNKYKLDMVLVTQGDKGAFICHKDQRVYRISISKNVKVLNSVGAGDAFSAIMILGIIHNWPLNVTLERANHFAGVICQIDGAVPDSTELYQQLYNEWK